jgi:fructose-specific phosphotransferase system IIC component
MLNADTGAYGLALAAFGLMAGVAVAASAWAHTWLTSFLPMPTYTVLTFVLAVCVFCVVFGALVGLLVLGLEQWLGEGKP